MRLSNYFDLRRFLLILKLEASRSMKGTLIAIDITIGILFIATYLMIFDDSSIVSYDHTDSYAFALLVGGFTITSISFRDLDDKLTKQSFLALPASTFERLLSMWLITSVGWIILYTIVFKIFTLVANPLGSVIFDLVIFESFDPFTAFTRSSIQYYFVLQGIFLVGATQFKGYVFPKTLFVIFLLAFFVMAVAYFSMVDIFMADHGCTGYDCELLITMSTYAIWPITKAFFWWVLAPLCWVVAYLGLRDQEV